MTMTTCTELFRQILVGVGFQFFRFNGFLSWKIYRQRVLFKADFMRKTFVHILNCIYNIQPLTLQTRVGKTQRQCFQTIHSL